MTVRPSEEMRSVLRGEVMRMEKKQEGMQYRVSNIFKTTIDFYAQSLIFYLSLDYLENKCDI